MITEEIRRAAEKARVWTLSTVNRDGTPRSIPIHFKKVLSAHEVLLMDNYMKTTLANLRERPDKVSVSFSAKGVYHLLGTARIETSGQIYEDGVKMVKAEREIAPAKSAVIITVTATDRWERPW